MFFKLHGPASILKCQKHIKLRQKQFHMKDTGKSSSRKLRYVVYYTVYRMDPQKTHQENDFCTSISEIRKLHGPTSIWEHQKNVKLRRKQFHMKDMGKSSSRKLRRVIYYILYRMDPQKTQYKISFSANIFKI